MSSKRKFQGGGKARRPTNKKEGPPSPLYRHPTSPPKAHSVGGIDRSKGDKSRFFWGKCGVPKGTPCLPQLLSDSQATPEFR